jgi:hypothetical protein
VLDEMEVFVEEVSKLWTKLPKERDQLSFGYPSDKQRGKITK